MKANSKNTRLRSVSSALFISISTTCLAGSVQAADEPSLEPVIVSATRFESEQNALTPGAVVITAGQIRAAGASNVNEAIRKIGGVLGRQNLTGSSDASLDLRGFGSTSDSNTVIMVDGVRLSEIDSGSALLSSIPIDSVERIEIVRGGSSVLFGSGATGGTIQVITRRGTRNQQAASVSAATGSFGHRELRASLSKGWESVIADVSASTQSADGYRRNGYTEQNNLSLGLQRYIEDGRIGLRTHFARQESGLPGSLTLAQFASDPRMTLKPQDYGSVDSDRYVLFAEKTLNGIDFAADLSHRVQRAKGYYPSMSYTASTESQANQFSPRLKKLSYFGSLRNELVAGIDVMRATRRGYSEDTQDADAVYVRNEIRNDRSSVAVGVRRENFRIFSAGLNQSAGLNAWDLHVAHELIPGATLFGKTGRSYRVANVDESSGAVGLLAPQTSNDVEVGTRLVHQTGKLTLSWFRHELRNEIIYNPDAPSSTPLFNGANVNLDPTLREGVELNVQQTLTESFRLIAAIQHVSPRFRQGANVGNDIPLVAHNTVSTTLYWEPGNGHRAYLGWQWVDNQRYGNDFSNSCSSNIPRFNTVQGRYAWRQANWEFALVGNNLTDKHYFSTAYGSCRNGIYPDPGRQMMLTARRDF